MVHKNVIFDCTLEQYNKKYRNRRHRLLKYTKKQVEDFDKQYGHFIYDNKTYNLENSKYLLKDRKWALIGDSYYEIPKPVRLTWFRNLSVGTQAALCLLGVGAVSSIVIFPTLSVTVWNKGGKPVVPEPVKEWYEDQNYINSLTTDDVSKGTVKQVTVNGQVHNVRLIGIDHDKDVDGNKLHTTWEFANLISDDQGYSLAYQWQDTNEASNQNIDYPNSSIRKILCGSGNFSSTVYCATKKSTNVDTPDWDDTYSYTSSNKKTILSMLPDNLKKVLKTVKKTVRVNTDSQGYTKAEDCSDKLFMLSGAEIGETGETKDEGTVYDYYDASKAKDRMKQQVKGSDGALTNSATIKTKKTICKFYDVMSFAGYNSSNIGQGGLYWLRSPQSSVYSNAWCCGFDGSVNICTVYNIALGVAPAFCI